VIIVNEAALHRHLKLFLEYDHQSRTHLSLEKETLESRSVRPPESGRVVAVPQVGRAASSVRTSRRLIRAGMSSGVTVTNSSTADSSRGRLSEVAPADPGALFG
jgi:hypothetical protein